MDNTEGKGCVHEMCELDAKIVTPNVIEITATPISEKQDAVVVVGSFFDYMADMFSDPMDVELRKPGGGFESDGRNIRRYWQDAMNRVFG